MVVEGFEVNLGLCRWILDRVVQVRHKTTGNRFEKAYAQKYLARGIESARKRDAKVLKILEGGSELLLNESQVQSDRFEAEGFAKCEYTESSSFRAALLLADEVSRQDTASLSIFGWLYAAVCELVYGTI